MFKHSPFSTFTLSWTSNQQDHLIALPNCDIILMFPVPACQALSCGKEECSTPRRIKFKKPGEKQQHREGDMNLRMACTSQHSPFPFTHWCMWSPPDKLTFTMLIALKLNSSYFSHVFMSWFPFSWFVFQTGMSENSGKRNIIGYKSLGKYYRGTLGAQRRKATSPSNS